MDEAHRSAVTPHSYLDHLRLEGLEVMRYLFYWGRAIRSDGSFALTGQSAIGIGQLILIEMTPEQACELVTCMIGIEEAIEGAGKHSSSLSEVRISQMAIEYGRSGLAPMLNVRSLDVRSFHGTYSSHSATRIANRLNRLTKTIHECDERWTLAATPETDRIINYRMYLCDFSLRSGGIAVHAPFGTPDTYLSWRLIQRVADLYTGKSPRTLKRRTILVR